MFFPAFREDEIICPVATLKVYLDRTEKLRSVGENGPNLFITVWKPHKSVTSATIFFWMRNLMAESGIDVDQFKPHSV